MPGPLTPTDYAMQAMTDSEKRIFVNIATVIVAKKHELNFGEYDDATLLDHAPLLLAALLVRFGAACEAAVAGNEEAAREVYRLRWLEGLPFLPLPAIN